MTSDLRLVVGGLKSLLPGVGHSGGTGGAAATRYGYSVWLRHSQMIAAAGLDLSRDVVVELGPGDSLGTGFAALLTTAKRYVALDVVPHAAAAAQLSALDATVALLEARTPIPDASEFPNLYPRLESYDFPSRLKAQLARGNACEPGRIAEIAEALQHMDSRSPDAMIRYVCPWSSGSVARASADLVFSQAALQEIDNRGLRGALRETFAAMSDWLKPGGVMSHQVDLGMYGAEPWDRHWTYSDPTWSVIRGRRENYVNREPLSTYEALLREFGFEAKTLDIVPARETIAVDRLSSRFRSLSDRDRNARAVHIVAVKRG
jgi:hypothetical protein